MRDPISVIIPIVQIQPRPFASLFIYSMIRLRMRVDTGEEIAFRMRPEGGMLDWVPVNSHFCAVRSNDSVRINNNRPKRRLVVHCFCVCAYLLQLPWGERQVLSEVSSITSKCSFDRSCGRCQQFWRQTWLSVETELQFGGSLTFLSGRTNHSDRLIQVCSDHRLFLANTTSSHKNRPHPHSALLGVYALDSDWSQYHRSPVEWIDWGPLIIIVCVCDRNNKKTMNPA